MNPFLRYLGELNKFLAWLKELHPDLCEKYKHNIDMPLMKGGRVTVNYSFCITAASRSLLLGIVESYYAPETSPAPESIPSFQ